MTLQRLIASVVISAVGAAALPAAAAPVPSQNASATTAQAEASTVAAERALVQSQLAGCGLTERAAADRVSLLTDQEVRARITPPNSPQAAGANAGAKVAVAVLVIAVIAVVILAGAIPPHK